MLENPRAVAAKEWITDRLAGDIEDDERELLTRVAEFPFERYPDYAAPWHLLMWPHMRWSYAARIVAIIEHFRHVKGSMAGQPITLEPFQVFILLCFLAPYDPDTGHRLVRTMLLTIARKNAKSSLTAAAITAAMALRPEHGGYYRQDVYVGASDREQAGEIYEMSSGFITQDIELGLHRKFRCVPSTKVVQHNDTLTKMKVLSSDAYRAHGRNAAAVVYDEIGNLPSTMAEEYYNVLTSGFGAQAEAMAWLLSTQAPTDAHIFSSMVDACKRINEGKQSEVENMAGFVFETPDRIGTEDVDPFDEQYWYLSNPGLLSPNGLGSTLLADLRQQAKEAKELPSLESKFRNRRLNQRANPHSPVISATRWKACAEPAFTLDDLHGQRCWVGLDLSSTQDMTAAVLVFEANPALDGRQPVSAMFWMPRQGWRAEDFKVAARDEGLDDLVDDEERFLEIYQTARFTEPCIEAVERALALEQITHAANPILTWNASNALAVRNSDGHRKWDKAKSWGRIDGIVALGMALRVRELQAMDDDGTGTFDDDDFIM